MSSVLVDFIRIFFVTYDLIAKHFQFFRELLQADEASIAESVVRVTPCMLSCLLKLSEWQPTGLLWTTATCTVEIPKAGLSLPTQTPPLTMLEDGPAAPW